MIAAHFLVFFKYGIAESAVAQAAALHPEKAEFVGHIDGPEVFGELNAINHCRVIIQIDVFWTQVAVTFENTAGGRTAANQV